MPRAIENEAPGSPTRSLFLRPELLFWRLGRTEGFLFRAPWNHKGRLGGPRAPTSTEKGQGRKGMGRFFKQSRFVDGLPKMAEYLTLPTETLLQSLANSGQLSRFFPIRACTFPSYLEFF